MPKLEYNLLCVTVWSHVSVQPLSDLELTIRPPSPARRVVWPLPCCLVHSCVKYNTMNMYVNDIARDMQESCSDQCSVWKNDQIGNRTQRWYCPIMHFTQIIFEWNPPNYQRSINLIDFHQSEGCHVITTAQSRVLVSPRVLEPSRTVFDFNHIRDWNRKWRHPDCVLHHQRRVMGMVRHLCWLPSPTQAPILCSISNGALVTA